MSDSPNNRDRIRLARLAELGLMTATLTHELRQPLFAIRSLAQLGQVKADGDMARYLAELVRQTELMEGIVGTVGAFARDDTGILVPMDLEAEVSAAMGLLEHLSRARGIRVVAELHGELPAVAGEGTALLQVLVNLVQNAFDASPRESQVRVRTDLVDGLVTLEVQDEGTGIPQDLAEQVFEPFFTTKPPDAGTGLGLYLARRLVEQCRGEISLVPVEVGTCVRVELVPWKGAGAT